MPRYFSTLAIACWLTTAELAFGQPAAHEPARKELAVSGVVLVPDGNWLRPGESVAGGGAFRALYPVAATRVSAGFDAQWLFYEDGPGGPEQILMAHGMLRAHLRRAARRPYVETLVGVKGFSVDPGTPGTYSYGAGAGMQFPLATRPPFGHDEQEFFEIGVRYIKGGGVRLRPERVERHTDGFIVYVGWGFRPRSSR